MTHKLPRMAGRSVEFKISRRCDHHFSLFFGQRHRDHILLDHLTQPDPCIEAGGDDVEHVVGYRDVDGDAWMGFGKGCDQRAGKKLFRYRCNCNPQQTTGPCVPSFSKADLTSAIG